MRPEIDPFEFGYMMGFHSAKAGSPRKCPYLPTLTEHIRGWYAGYDDFPTSHSTSWDLIRKSEKQRVTFQFYIADTCC